MITERVAYVNGSIVPESEAKISIRDTGLVYGDSVFDTARTFGGQLFRLGEHVDRLMRSLHSVRIDAGLSRTEWIDITTDLVQRNLPVLRQGEDYWVTQRVTNGAQILDGESANQTGATIVIDCIPIPLRARAKFFRDGIDAAIPQRRRISPDALSPNIKSNNYLNMMLAQREVQDQFPGTWALMKDPQDYVAEGAGCNFFAIKNGVVLTPPEKYILCGISRDVVIELCNDNNIPMKQKNLSEEEAIDADEAFFTSTSLCVCPVRSLNGQNYTGGVPGPTTARIMQLFSNLIQFDFVGQYLAFADTGASGTGL